jgi:hypothetical protein
MRDIIKYTCSDIKEIGLNEDGQPVLKSGERLTELLRKD